MGKNASSHVAVRREENEALIRLAAPAPVDRVLDVACGPGTLLLALAPLLVTQANHAYSSVTDPTLRELPPACRLFAKDDLSSPVLLARPDVLLLDEPLAAVDLERRRRIVEALVRIRDEMAVPIVYVTHMPEEAYAIADVAVLVSNGRMGAAGVPRTVIAPTSGLSGT